MKIIHFYGLRRSGNHAILEWLLHSMGKNMDKDVVKLNRIIKRGDVAYFNDCGWWSSNPLDFNRDLAEQENKGLRTAILTYEDLDLTYKKIDTTYSKIVLIRDIFPLAASRIKRGSGDMLVDQKFVDKWISYARSFEDSSCLNIKYEDWLTSKEYRDNFLLKLGYLNLDKIDQVSTIGDGSSFVGKSLDSKENLLNRHKQVKFTPEIEKLLNQPRVVEWRKRIGYE